MTNQYGAPQPPYGGGQPQTTPEIEQIKKNALIATIIGFLCGGTIPGILGLIGYIQAPTQPATARNLVKWAWISFAIIWAIAILFIIAYVVFIVVLGFGVWGASQTGS